MTKPLTLDHIAKLLETYQFEFTKQESTEEIPFEQLLVLLGEIDEERPLILHIRLFGDIPLVGEEEGAEEDPETAWAKQLGFINFFIALPLTIQEDRVIDTGRVALMLNKVLPMPGFGVSEVDRAVFYQYTSLIKSHTLDTDLLLGILAMIVHLIDTHLPTFQEIAEGKKTFEELISEGEDILPEENKE